MKTHPAVLKTLLQASDFHRRGEPEEAETLIRQALAAAPNFHLLTNRGIRQDAAGNLEAATLYFRQAAELRPRSARAHYNLGTSLAEQGLLEASITALRRAVSLNPNDPDSHEWLGIEPAKVGLTAEALSEFDRAIQLRPAGVRAYLSKGAVLWDVAELASKSTHHPKWTQARDVFLAATEAAPAEAEAHYGLGACEFSLKRFSEAITALQTAIHLSPDTEHYYMALGQSQWRSHQWYAFCQTGRAYCRLQAKHREASANLAARNGKE